jgi:hypothetical protein
MSHSANINQSNAIGNGEVDSSILSGSTSFPLENNGLANQPLRVPPLLNRERRTNSPQSVGENAGTLFLHCSRSLCRDWPPDPEMQRAARQGDPNCKSSISSTDLTETSRQLQAFIARCDARAHLWSEWMIDLQDAVDGLQAAAECTGLIADLGQDQIQKIMSDAFAARRNVQC